MPPDSAFTYGLINKPETRPAVPWIWIRALGTAWERYKTEGGTLGQSFGPEGGQGKSPIDDKLKQMLQPEKACFARAVSNPKCNRAA